MEIDGPITWSGAAAADGGKDNGSVLFRCPESLDFKLLDGIDIDTTPGACTRYA